MLKHFLPPFVKAKANMQAYISTCDDVEHLKLIVAALQEKGLAMVSLTELASGWKLGLYGKGLEAKQLTKGFRDLSEVTAVDIALVDAVPKPSLLAPGILFMDMDSTLIQCECIDEIADYLGIKDKIASITQAAMEGKIDFSESLLARVKLLAGLDESVLKQVYEERIWLTDGAEDLIRTVQGCGWKVGLVSGGFTYFTNLLQQRLELDFTAANTLEIIDGKLTGRVLGRIVDAQVKQQLLVQQSEAWGIDVGMSVALGDGANDLPMLNAAGIGIAFHAKPKVQKLAPYALSSGGLNQALHLLIPLKGL